MHTELIPILSKRGGDDSECDERDIEYSPLTASQEVADNK